MEIVFFFFFFFVSASSRELFRAKVMYAERALRVVLSFAARFVFTLARGRKMWFSLKISSFASVLVLFRFLGNQRICRV